jgi:hypothetical protein
MRSRSFEDHLKGISVAAWLALLNARVFLFTQQRYVQRLLKAYKTEGQEVIKLKTAALLAAYADRVEVTTINAWRYLTRPAHRGAPTRSFRWRPSRPTRCNDPGSDRAGRYREHPAPHDQRDPSPPRWHEAPDLALRSPTICLFGRSVTLVAPGVAGGLFREVSALQRGRDGGELLVQLLHEPLVLPGVEVGAGSEEALVAHGRP